MTSYSDAAQQTIAVAQMRVLGALQPVTSKVHLACGKYFVRHIHHRSRARIHTMSETEILQRIARIEAQADERERKRVELDQLADNRMRDKFAALDQARSLQAQKDAKHFEDLNGEQQRLDRDRERYLPRETYTADRKDKLAAMIAITALLLNLLTLVAMVTFKLMGL